MATFNDGESGSSVRTKINASITKTDQLTVTAATDLDAIRTKIATVEDGATNNTGALADLNTVGAAQIDAEAITEAKLDALDTPADGEVLAYDSGTGRLEWVAQSGGAVALADLTDVDATVGSPSDGDILVYRSAGTDWVLEAKPAAGSGSTDLTLVLDETSATISAGGAEDAVIPAATSSEAGVLSSTDKDKIDSIGDLADPVEDAVLGSISGTMVWVSFGDGISVVDGALTAAGGSGADDQTAAEVSFDNAGLAMTADNVQEALAELKALLDSVADVPDAFDVLDWDVDDADLGGTLAVTITALPSAQGSAITDIEYRVDAGTWTSSGGISDFQITGLTDDVEVDVELRAVNAIGEGAASDVKPATPTAPAVTDPEQAFRVGGSSAGTNWTSSSFALADRPVLLFVTTDETVSGANDKTVTLNGNAMTQKAIYNRGNDNISVHFIASPGANASATVNVVPGNSSSINQLTVEAVYVDGATDTGAIAQHQSTTNALNPTVTTTAADRKVVFCGKRDGAATLTMTGTGVTQFDTAAVLSNCKTAVGWANAPTIGAYSANIASSDSANAAMVSVAVEVVY